MKAQRIHTPAQDYSAMDAAALQQLRESMLKEVHTIEHPSLLRRFMQGYGKGLAATVTAIGIVFAAKRSYLKDAPSSPSAMPEATTKADKKHPLTFTTDLSNLPDGKTLAWSCAGCGGCAAGGMGGKCFPAMIDENSPLLSDKAEDGKYRRVTEAQLAEFQRTADFPNKMRNRFAKSPDNEIVLQNLEIPGVKEFLGQEAEAEKSQTAAPKNTKTYRFDSFTPSQTHDRQTAFTTSAAVIGAVGAYSLADRLMNKPKRDKAHHLKHEIQHIEDELSFRERLQNAPSPKQASRG